ncbi:MAG: hypothetical protein JWR80_4004 [Bradyrhizobium sp.]|nr:hypothetical protein [Bradyrhizobium sp.]
MRIAPIIAVMLAWSLSPVAAQAPARAHEQTPAPVPRPRLISAGTEVYTAGGVEWQRYRLSVANRAAFPAVLFAPSPDLPPCGTNTTSARSWIDIYDGDGKRLYGFCALGKPADLQKLWFALRSDTAPPAFAYIELLDRLTGKRYRSNKVAIPRPMPVPGGPAAQPGKTAQH